MKPWVLQAATGAVLELLKPAGLWLLTLLIPLVILYILKIKRSRLRVASTWLWASAQRDLMARAPFKKLIAQVPLILQALVLLMLGLALARPATRGRELTGDHVAFVIDVSASMSTTAMDRAGKPTTRLALAKDVAKDLVSALTPGSDALILEASNDARIVAPLDRDVVRIKASIDRIAQRDVEGDLAAAIALAVDRLRQLGGSRRIVVVTDGNIARAEPLQAASLPLEIMTVGQAVDNEAIVRVDVRSGNDPALNKEQLQAFLLIANFGQSPRDVYVTMRQDNTSDVLASRRALIQPGERLPVVLTFHPAPGDYKKGLIFEISPHDAMAIDDVAYGRVPAGDKLPVFLASASGSPWIERAITSDPMVSLTSDNIAALATSRAVDLETFVVVDGACPDNPPGGYLLIVNPPKGRCFGTVVGQTLERPIITSWATSDPRLRFLTLDGVQIERANSLKPEGVTQELIRSQEGILATDISAPHRAATLIGFDVGESDWPLKASFVLFVRNLLEQARAQRAHGVTGPARAGEPMRARVPLTAEKLEAIDPENKPVEVSVRGGLAVVADTPHTGFYRFAWQGSQAGTLLVPANLTSAAESDLSPKPLVKGSDSIAVSTADNQPEAHNEWTWVLALVAFGFVVLDIWYFTRPARVKSPVAAPAAPRIPERRVV